MQRWKAVEHLLLYERAAEELLRIVDDIKSTLEHYKVLHHTFSQAVFSVTHTTEQALLKRKILEMEVIIKSIWKVACKYVDNVEPIPSFMDRLMDANVDVPASDFDSTSCEYVVDSDQEYDSEED